MILTRKTNENVENKCKGNAVETNDCCVLFLE